MSKDTELGPPVDGAYDPFLHEQDIPGNSFTDLILGMALALGCGLAVYFGAVTAYNIWRSFYG